MRNIFLFGLVMAFVFSFAKEGQRHLSVKIESQQEQKIIELEKQVKSQEEQKNSYKNNIEIIEKIEGFYDRSWNKLIWLLGTIGGIGGIGLGIILPIYMNRLQKKEFDKELQRHKEDFEKYVEETNREKENEIKTFFNEKYKEWKVYIDKTTNENEKKLIDFFNNQYTILRQESGSDISAINQYIYNEINSIYSFNYRTIGLFLILNGIDAKEGLISLVNALEYILKNENTNPEYISSVVEPILRIKESYKIMLEEPEKIKILNVLKSLKERFPKEFDVDSVIEFINKSKDVQ